MEISVILMILASLLFGANLFILRSDTKALENLVREQALQLFLSAEKTDLIGEEKMNYVAEKIYDLVDESIIVKVIEEDTIKEWLQKLYNKVKHNLLKIKEE